MTDISLTDTPRGLHVAAANGNVILSPDEVAAILAAMKRRKAVRIADLLDGQPMVWSDGDE